MKQRPPPKKDRTNKIKSEFFKKDKQNGSSNGGSVETKLTSIHEDVVQSLAFLSGLRFWCCHELWCRSQMWLGPGIAVAVA